VRVLSIVGNRPQFIKSALLSEALRAADVDEVVVHTGQHWDDAMSEVFFAELGLAEPAHRLDLRTADPDAIRPKIVEAIGTESTDLIVVFGDTNTTLAGARAGVEAGVPIAHVEAGLRSGDLEMPEERNRIEVDRISAVLFAPDARSAATLHRETVPGEVHVVGDVMADVAQRFAPLARGRSRILERLELEPGGYVVATVHREANVRPERLRRIVAGLSASTRPVVLPAHPRTRRVLEAERIELPQHVRAIEPLGYLDLAALASQAAVIATDSGGLQKEAYWYGVPCVTLRPSTEWVDTVETGANTLVDDDPGRIAEALANARLPDERPVLYGDGHASGRIAAVVVATINRRGS
jgi:UDP-N-acetylglucosamine 2-epimerase (non-hydrolysing)/UDP-GlcNAc3NAcA epimerase